MDDESTPSWNQNSMTPEVDEFWFLYMGNNILVHFLIPADKTGEIESETYYLPENWETLGRLRETA